jgi:predicted lactoylglutathione lyase
MQTRVTLVTLGYTDFDRARRFYETLGWVGSSPDGEVFFMQAGSMVLALWDRGKLAEDSTMVDGGGWGGITLAHNVASRAEVDAVLAEAKAAGGTIGRPGAPTEWGGYSGIFVDTEGHPWEVAHNPFWKLEADGALRLP